MAIPTTQDVVLQRVVARLISQLSGSGFAAANCYVADPPEPPTTDMAHNLFVLVTAGSGQYPDDVHAGGGANTPFEESSVWVTIYSRIKLDRPFAADASLTNASRGLLPIKRLVLKALCGHNLLDGSGNEILTRYMAPFNCSQPGRDTEDFAAVSLAFHTDFEWDLS